MARRNPVKYKEIIWIHDKSVSKTFHFLENINEVTMNEDKWILDRYRIMDLLPWLKQEKK